ncbi:MAG: S8 family serine peptidase [Elusimicrobia bacterium]|nr:S8 family serine peptidase [Elusimicrobiota bacterium]
MALPGTPNLGAGTRQFQAAQPMPFPFPFPLDPGLVRGDDGAARQPGTDAVTAVRFLQNHGIPPSLYLIDPADAAGKLVRVDLYDFQPANPTAEGRHLADTLRALSEQAIQKISKKKLYVLLSLIKDLSAEEAKATSTAFPEMKQALAARINQVLAMDLPEDKDFAGLGTDAKPLQQAIEERRALLDKLIAQAEVLPAETPQAQQAKAATLAALREQASQLKTLDFAEGGAPLIPHGLYNIVRSMPEPALTAREWEALFESYPMGRSLWEMRIDRLWRGALSGKGVRVAILDTGIDKDHPDVAGSVFDEANFTSHRYTEEVTAPSGDVHRVGDADNRGEHGSHVASTVHAIAPEAEILNIKVLDAEAANIPDDPKHDMTQTITAIYDGLDYVLKYNRDIQSGKRAGQPIDVVSMSLGLPSSNTQYSGAQRDLLSRKVKELADAGVIVVVAAGNEGDNTARRPGMEASAVTVGAVDHFGRKASFSSNRSVVDTETNTFYDVPTVWAPGTDILAAKYDPREEYKDKDTKGLHQYMSGTSMATPHVAGVVALLVGAAKEQGVTLTPAQMQSLLKDSSTPVAGENPYARTGGGIIDPDKALQLLRERYGKPSVAAAQGR